ncbi:MAG: NAD(P)H-dependent oxidoreductase [Candidatus Omnitrophota bacterium]
MKRLLHIIATPRGADSRTLKVSAVFLEELKKKYPDCAVDELNVSTEKLPSLTVQVVEGKYVLLGGRDLTGKLKTAWKEVERHIERFLAADIYLVSTPMWNFSIPYTLKQYIDVILQPRYLFRYTDKGAEGLVKGRKMVVITSRGGDYGPSSPARAYDLQEPYLKTAFGFAGISDMTFINAEPMDALGPDVCKAKISEARSKARETASRL